MALTPQQREALIRAEQSARAQVRARLVEYGKAVWNGLGSWRDADIERFVAQSAPRVLAGQRTIAQLTDVYLAQMTGLAPVGVVDVSDLRGVASSEVYRRPAVEMRTALSEGASMTDALKAGAVRLGSLIATDLQMANIRQARSSLLSGVGGFRRTLTGRENCALCALASTQRYHRGDLLPIHPGCDCGVAPLSDRDIFDQVIDPGLLEQIHARVGDFTGTGDRGGRDLGLGKSTSDGTSLSDFTDLIITREHGEIGPLLSWRSNAFTGPGDLAA